VRHLLWTTTDERRTRMTDERRISFFSDSVPPLIWSVVGVLSLPPEKCGLGEERPLAASSSQHLHQISTFTAVESFSAVEFFVLPTSFFVELVRFFSLIHCCRYGVYIFLRFFVTLVFVQKSESLTKCYRSPLQATGGAMGAAEGGNTLIWTFFYI
jgi:hypothetical protein